MATVRRATPEDARTIADIQIETWRATYVGVMPQDVLDEFDVDESTRSWEHWLGVETTAQFVAERSGAAVGFASAGPCRHDPESGEVYAIYVRPEAWGTGSGWALMDAAVAWLAERWREAILWVAEENPRARRFYERYGWVAESTRVEEVVPGAHIPEVLYRLSGLRDRLTA
jgi:GNAT superfamily N-acetyltransferase